MTAVLVPALIIAGIGAVCGIVLSIVSVMMAVPVDEKEKAVKDVLPGANCGACGYPGCEGYAVAVAKGEAPVNACPPGGDALRLTLGEIMGVEAGAVTRQAALVSCGGCTLNTSEKMNYIGEGACVYANLMYGGQSACSHGCLGFADCVKACPYDAIDMINGLAVVDPDRCTGCTLCVAACPKELIAMAPAEGIAVVACFSKDRGSEVRKICSVGCIGCGLCVKACPEGAIAVNQFLAGIDCNKCTGCGLCVPACPQNTIRMLGGCSQEAGCSGGTG